MFNDSQKVKHSEIKAKIEFGALMMKNRSSEALESRFRHPALTR